jgi:hypothetical protein
MWRVHQDVASLSLFERVDGVWHTLGLNDTCHLTQSTSPEAQPAEFPPRRYCPPTT